MNPWNTYDPRLRTSDLNMAFVIQTSLRSGFDYVILSSIVLSSPTIRDRILSMITGVDYQLISFTLMADEHTLIERARERDGNRSPNFTLLAQTRELEGTIRIDTANRSLDDVVEEMLSAVNGFAGDG